jgi:hypothetical protein
VTFESELTRFPQIVTNVILSGFAGEISPLASYGGRVSERAVPSMPVANTRSRLQPADLAATFNCGATPVEYLDALLLKRACDGMHIEVLSTDLHAYLARASEMAVDANARP